MQKQLFTAVLIAIGAATYSVPAMAQTTTATMGVSLVVEDSCSITAEPLTFPNAGVISADIPATADLTVTCTTGTPFQIGLAAGTGGSTTARVLTGAVTNQTVDYQLYRDNGHTLVWGNSQGVDTLEVAAANGGPQTVTVYGLVPQGQVVPADTYEDSITATIWYADDVVNPE